MDEGSFLSILSTLIGLFGLFFIPVCMAIFNRQLKRRDERVEKRADVRRSESLLNMRLTLAIGELCSANATAIKNGKPNGETDAALSQYRDAKGNMDDFLRQMAAEHLSGKG